MIDDEGYNSKPKDNGIVCIHKEINYEPKSKVVKLAKNKRKGNFCLSRQKALGPKVGFVYWPKGYLSNPKRYDIWSQEDSISLMNGLRVLKILGNGS